MFVEVKLYDLILAMKVVLELRRRHFILQSIMIVHDKPPIFYFEVTEQIYSSHAVTGAKMISYCRSHYCGGDRVLPAL